MDLSKRGGAQGRLEILGRALFGLEHWGKDNVERVHGYSAGEIRFEGTARKLCLWPRAGYKRQAGNWGLDKDVTCELDADESLSEEIGNNPRRPVAPPAPIALPLPAVSPVAIAPPVAPVPTPIAPSAASAPLPPPDGPLGWTLVDAAFLSTVQLDANLSPQALTRYFDGQVPGLRHALCPGVPRRAVVARVVAKLQESAEGKTPAMVVLLGGGGEGKTTALFQAAADLARSANAWKVLWRPDAETPLRADDVPALGPGPWVLVADDADRLVKPLSDAELGSLTTPDPTTQGYFERHAAAANKVPAPTFADAITWLTQAVEMARKRVPVGQIPPELPSKPLSFERLRTTLAPSSAEVAPSAKPPRRKK